MLYRYRLADANTHFFYKIDTLGRERESSGNNNKTQDPESLYYLDYKQDAAKCHEKSVF
jgi:hypothetical protein